MAPVETIVIRGQQIGVVCNFRVKIGLTCLFAMFLGKTLGLCMGDVTQGQ